MSTSGQEINKRSTHRLGGTTGFLILGSLLFLSCADPSTDSTIAPSIELPSDPIQWVSEKERQPVDLSGTFQTVEGENVSLLDASAEGNVVFLNLWATWCGPCLAEMPSMVSLYENLSENGLAMVAVSDEDPETVQKFLQGKSYPFTILLDPENILGQRFEVMAIPSTLIIDRQKRMALRQTGAYDWNSPEVVEQFRPLLAGN